jgi:hydrogenase maturation protease
MMSTEVPAKHDRPSVLPLVLGIGSPHGDDRIGWLAVEKIRRRSPVPVVAHTVSGGIELLEHLSDCEAAFVIDAAYPAGTPGAMQSVVWPHVAIAGTPLLSTHGLSLFEALRLAEILGSLPRHVSIHTVEALCTSPGDSLSGEVARQLEPLVDAVLRDIVAVCRDEQTMRANPTQGSKASGTLRSSFVLRSSG